MRSDSIECDLFSSLLNPPSGLYFLCFYFIFRCCCLILFLENYFSTSASVYICKLYVIVCGVRSFFLMKSKCICFSRARTTPVLLCRTSLPKTSDYRLNSLLQIHRSTAHAIEAIDMSTAITCFDIWCSDFHSFLAVGVFFLLLLQITSLLLLENKEREKNIVHQNKCIFSCQCWWRIENSVSLITLRF